MGPLGVGLWDFTCAVRTVFLGAELLPGPFCCRSQPSLPEAALSPWVNFSLKVALNPLQVPKLLPLTPGLGNQGVNTYNLPHFQARQSPRGVPTSPGESSSHQLNAHKCAAEPEEERQPWNYCQTRSLLMDFNQLPDFSHTMARARQSAGWALDVTLPR